MTKNGSTSAAYNMLCSIPGVPACFNPSRDAVDALALDLSALREDLIAENKPALWADTVAELTRRIGGLQNLGSYMASIMVRSEA